MLPFHEETNCIDEKALLLSLDKQGVSFPLIKKASQSAEVA